MNLSSRNTTSKYFPQQSPDVFILQESLLGLFFRLISLLWKLKRKTTKRKAWTCIDPQRLQNSRTEWRSNFLKNQHTLTSILTCLQGSQHKIMTENRTLTMLSTELFDKAKQAPPSCPLARPEKIATSLHRHLLSFALKADTKVTSLAERRVRELKYFLTTTWRTEHVKLNSWILKEPNSMNQTIIVPFLPLSIESHAR